MLGHRVLEFLVVFLSIKLLTALLGAAQFGEFTLAQTATQLAANILLMPMNQAYLRYYHTAYEQGAQGTAGRQLFFWYACVTIGLLVTIGAITMPLATLLSVAALTPLATAVWFAADRWRNLALEIFELRRERSSGAMASMTYQIASLLALLAGLWLLPRMAWVAILISSAVALIWAFASLRPEWRRISSAPPDAPSQLKSLVRSFGLPAAALLVFQWVQSNVDRYLVASYVSKSSAGVYVAANQLFGAPTLLMINVMNWLILPVAYQRARDIKVAEQLWSADKVVLTGIGLYFALGVCVLPVCYFWGPWLLTLMTTADFQLSGVEITLIGLTRLLQGAFILVQIVFAVHQRMVSSLTLRILGALIAVPAIWIGVRAAGISGAAAGAALSSVAYMLLLLFGPAGAFWMIRDNRRRMRAAPAPAS